MTTMEQKTRKSSGQYFTTNLTLKEKVLEFIMNNPSTILEPSIGQGDLVTFITEKLPTVTFDMYEIDRNIPLLEGVSKDSVVYGDFMTQTITKTYTTIVGNPPYVRTQKGNLYIDFTEKCYHLLDEKGGELIFIVPSDFFKLTGASKLLKEMMTKGTFTHIFHPHNEKLFENATIDIIVFRYCKNSSENKLIQKQVLYNDRLLYITNSSGLITFGEEEEEGGKNNRFQDYFDVYVGLVSGKEDVYKNKELGTMEVLNGENKLDPYIYIEHYPCEKESINTYLLQHKKELMDRKIRKFNENNWFEWGAPRNITTIRRNLGKDCIYIYNLTRRSVVAFLGKVNYFGGGLLMLQPKEIGMEVHLQDIVSYLNSPSFKSNFIFSGRFKIGHRQLCNSSLPGKYL
jgi:adenine-specific DNA-methyltransferase